MTQARTEETQIGEFRYRTRPLPPRQSIGVMMKVAKVVAPGAGSIGDAMNMLKAEIGGPITAMADRLDDDQVWEVIQAMASVAEFKGATGGQWTELGGAFDVHFLGKDLDMLQWLWWAMGVQYRPLFETIRQKFFEVFGIAEDESAEESSDQTGSRGLSGVSSSQAPLH